MEWQPIETAPRDGTEVLLYVGVLCHDYGVAWWNGEWWNMGSREYAGMKDRFDVEFGAPTHWMPLPAPPKATPERFDEYGHYGENNGPV